MHREHASLHGAPDPSFTNHAVLETRGPSLRGARHLQSGDDYAYVTVCGCFNEIMHDNYMMAFNKC